GCDYTYPNAHDAERGRACLEFHIGIAKARGTKIGLPARTSLMHALYSQQDRLYGYDTLDLELSAEDGRVRVLMTPRGGLPSADEIERRYDHSRPVKPLLRGAA